MSIFLKVCPRMMTLRYFFLCLLMESNTFCTGSLADGGKGKGGGSKKKGSSFQTVSALHRVSKNTQLCVNRYLIGKLQIVT